MYRLALRAVLLGDELFFDYKHEHAGNTPQWWEHEEKDAKQAQVAKKSSGGSSSSAKDHA